MAARIREDYITVAIEPPFVPEEKYWPNKLLAVLLGTFLGGALSVGGIVAQYFIFGVSKDQSLVDEL